MSVASLMAYRMTRHTPGQGNATGVHIKRGADEIIGDGPYPRSFTEFVGQTTARMQLLTAMRSAAKRQQPMDHVLLASGAPGIGKTTLAKICAVQMGVGYAELGGTVTAKDARKTLHAMSDGDVLFFDEIHRLVSQGKRNAEWLLQLLQDGVLALPTGVERVARITVIGATTDAQKLPQTILDRFPIQPVLEPYGVEECIAIAETTARRMGFGEGGWAPIPEDRDKRREWLEKIARAADCNPRRIGTLLGTVRDIALANEADPQTVTDTALKWTGLSADGLNQLAQDYLMVLYGYGGTAGLTTIKSALNEEVLTITERQLIQKGYLMVTAKGRELTTLGMDRAAELLAAMHPEGE